VFVCELDITVDCIKDVDDMLNEEVVTCEGMTPDPTEEEEAHAAITGCTWPKTIP